MGRAADEEAKKQAVISGEAKSFKMDRRSPPAAALHAAVAEKLFHFLGNYSDNVLAEYIVVLVCNGKNQYQARDDLKAFLGDDSGKFVAWLWDYLNRETSLLPLHASVPAGVANVSHKLNGQKTCRVVVMQSGGAPVSKAGFNEPSRSSVKSTCPNSDVVLKNMESNSLNDGQVNAKISRQQVHPVVQKLHLTNEGQNSARRCMTSTLRISPERLTGGEQCFGYESLHQKRDHNNSSATAFRSYSIMMSDPTASNMQATTQDEFQHGDQLTRNAATRRLPSKAVDVEVPQLLPKRGNVWDRLGKPIAEDDGLIRGNNNLAGHDGARKRSKSLLVEHEPESCGNLNRRLQMFDKASSRITSNSYAGNHRIQVGQSDKRTPNHVETSNRKRQFRHINSGSTCASLPGLSECHIQDREISQKADVTLPVKYDRPQTLNALTSDVKSSPRTVSEAACHLRKSIVGKASASDKLSQLHVLERSTTEALQNLPIGRPTQSKTGSVIHEGRQNGCNKPMKHEMLEMKLKLRQVEMDMLKLRSKHVQMNNAGAQRNLEDDPTSRSVLVTNVHFGATKEALSSHFTKCGTVLNVIMLTDTITAQPKGAAYIDFASKESAEAAVSLSGTSFFSRVLKVVHKADTPPGFLAVPGQQALKPLQPWNCKPFQKNAYQKQCTSSHLQWRRDQSVGRENSQPVAMDKLETSQAAE